MICVENDKVI